MTLRWSNPTKGFAMVPRFPFAIVAVNVFGWCLWLDKRGRCDLCKGWCRCVSSFERERECARIEPQVGV